MNSTIPHVTPFIRVLVVGLGASSIVAYEPLAAQNDDRPQKYNTAAVIAGNAALGSLTVVIGHVFRSKQPSLGKLAKGAAGGTAVFAGKAIAADRRWYAGLAGRQLASMGGSAIQNVASGRGYADRALLPWGPLRFHVERSPALKVRAKVDVAGVVAAVIGVTGDNLEVDFGKSLQYGAVVLRNTGRTEGGNAVGSHLGGVIRYRTQTAFSGAATTEIVDAIISHELVHVLQSDFLFNAWAAPVESYALGKSRAGRAINRYVDLGVHVPFAAWLNGVVEYSSRPWEREAVSLVTAPPGQ